MIYNTTHNQSPDYNLRVQLFEQIEKLSEIEIYHIHWIETYLTAKVGDIREYLRCSSIAQS
jgi:hypothetical protein